MQVTRAAEYGVLGLLSLARHQPGQVVMLDEISREERIPRSFLAKIFQSLARAGLVRSARGTRGGFMLARPAEGITTLEIIEAVEGPISLQRCLQAPGQCPQTGGCPLCGLFADAQSQVRSVFSQTALSDLLNRTASGRTEATDASRASSSTHSPNLSLPL